MDKEKSNIQQMMQGSTACVEGAIASGCRFFAGYPITPSSEIAEELAIKLPAIGGSFIQVEDEIAAMGAIIQALRAEINASHPKKNAQQINIKEASGGLRDTENFLFILKTKFEISDPISSKLIDQLSA